MRPRPLHRFGAALAIAMLAGFTPSVTISARAASTAWVGDAHASVRMITRDDRVGEGASVEAGLEFRFAPGWHGYWRTPGDAGLPPMIDWSASDNLVRGDVAWPAPTRLVVEGLQNSVYTGHVVLPVTFLLKSPGQAASLRASVGYAACSNVCVPFEAHLSLTLPSGTAEPSPEAPLIAAARAEVPGSPEAAGIEVVSASRNKAGDASSLVVDLRSTGNPFAHPDLFVEGDGSGLPGPPMVDLQDGGRTARLTVGLGESAPLDRPLTVTITDGTRAATFDQRPTQGLAVPVESRVAPWILALMSALLGGLILNLMPCVLPVLSIKLMGLIRHAGAGRPAMRMSLAATAMGVVASFLGLALALIGLQRSGASLGWGIQFQQPWFLAGMASLTVLFAASLFDWVVIGLPGRVMNAMGARSLAPLEHDAEKPARAFGRHHTPSDGNRSRSRFWIDSIQKHRDLVEAFLTGAFATLLATPCSAPFVGTAVGFALAQGPAEILGIFLCLGLGMALPYAAAAAFPGLVRWVPRPGPWMITLRTVFGFLLLGTAGWLLFVLWTTAGGVAAGAVLTLLAGMLALRALYASRPGADRRRLNVTTAILVLAPLAVTALPIAKPVSAALATNWQAFDPEALPGLVAQGKTVLVDVTASWCLTCKVNDLAALDRRDIAARFDDGDLIRMRADWSRPDPSIAAYLHRFGRYGIPLDVVYGPFLPAGEPLPELLTPGIVNDALDRASLGFSPLAVSAPRERSISETADEPGAMSAR